MSESATQPYSKKGLEALQKSLELHRDLGIPTNGWDDSNIAPIVWVDPAQNQLGVKKFAGKYSR